MEIGSRGLFGLRPKVCSGYPGGMAAANAYMQKKPQNLAKSLILRFCGMDGTRTRDLLRDRQAF